MCKGGKEGMGVKDGMGVYIRMFMDVGEREKGGEGDGYGYGDLFKKFEMMFS